jgi:hypothetical protein
MALWLIARSWWLLLLAYKADGSSPLSVACRQGMALVVTRCLEGGALPVIPEVQLQRDTA